MYYNKIPCLSDQKFFFEENRRGLGPYCELIKIKRVKRAQGSQKDSGTAAQEGTEKTRTKSGIARLNFVSVDESQGSISSLLSRGLEQIHA